MKEWELKSELKASKDWTAEMVHLLAIGLNNQSQRAQDRLRVPSFQIFAGEGLAESSRRGGAELGANLSYPVVLPYLSGLVPG